MKHYTPENFHLTQSIGFHLNKARNSLLLEMDSALRPLDINGQQMGILLALTRGMAGTPFEISKLLGIDSGLMTRMLDRLEEKGLLERSRSIDDRRVVNLTLTSKGRLVSAEIPSIAPEVLNERLKEFTPEEFDEFRRLLQKFVMG
ncbi:DNA-binding MarR family transcriptional regulator [Cupriavidus metallidurans]|uniref:Regulatory protein, MarR family n=1 Tax=Cupriavidus metallidurans (strain ATCC 43123 / DSM 2839 / NBRC 102507 / CH34) TaxID=266264 RepID=Q1LMZ2_CUPMC|nr:MarR family transcriptional regulator [Cupriavidus metallidurans]ABF08484.1 Regulatory protein, MarR family [Cupriavidus metallidurans CH34]AVA33601.1 MarR family transcriptional regulator [Cupriavidus metallidurans]MDE4917826.1 MarR family transcriptional regulator [Cupriavidus metallidurans]QGS30557.1 MarR family transcriptional regulator [Cupriavidus metallidurans]UBM12384.1 MarR family transcriptional regulator [Cupriavidus metallidurans]